MQFRAADAWPLRGVSDYDQFKANLIRGGAVLGICGGYQMLGRTIADPEGIEGPPGAVDGLGLLDIETRLESEKALEHVGGTALAARFSGYEMHMGRTTGPDCTRPFALLDNGRADGAIAPDGRVIGTYVHGALGDGLVLAERARLRQEAVDQRGLAVVDVGNDGDIAQVHEAH